MRRTEATNPVSKKKNMKFKILNIDVQHYKPRNRTIGFIWRYE
ncbi:hypothetical protein [Capnocytophaga cynodegmi]|nr:hypothetical protein [Capnocytophaga cynodegmi]